MNKQLKLNPDGSVKARGIEWTNYTSNPIGGCLHGCQWVMPDGSVANCYAEDVAEGVAQAAYPQGFEHYYWNPKEMDKWKSLKPGSKVFVGSMADVFGHWVPKENIQEMLDRIRELPEVTFQLLTKNPLGAVSFQIPKNVWLGASTPPNKMWGKELNQEQRAKMFNRTLEVLGRIKIQGTTVWISAEPLTLDAAHYLHNNLAPDWIVVGAASNGKTYYPPDENWTRRVSEFCDQYEIPLFFKGNLKSLPWAVAHWHEEFPDA